MTNLMDSIAFKLSPLILAQTEAETGANSDQLITSPLGTEFFGSLLNLGKAVLILVVGLLIANIGKSIIRKLLKQTDVDNQIAAWVGGSNTNLPIENIIADIVYWLIVLFALVAFLNALDLQAVSEPLNSLLGQVTSFVPQILGAGFILGIAWVLATLTKLLITRGLGMLRLEERLGQPEGDSSQAQSFSLSETIGNVLYWFIFLLFFPSILSTLQLQGTLQPVQALLNEILVILPNIFGAVLIGAVGWLLAQIIRRVVTNLLAATGVDRVGSNFGLSGGTGAQSLSWILGTIVYVLVLIPTAIAALDKLQIAAISTPATAMLNQVLAIVPNLFAAGVILILAYIAGQYIAQLVTNILTGLGFNNIMQSLGLAAAPSSEPVSESSESANQVSQRTPSELAGIVVLVAIMLVATLTAVDILKIEALKGVVGGVLVIAGQVFVGLIVFAIGLYLANLAFNLITSSGTRQSKFLGQTARIAIIILVSAMALQQMGIAPNIVNLAFGLLVGGIAVAIALAFGLGGKEIATEQIREWLAAFKQD